MKKLLILSIFISMVLSGCFIDGNSKKDKKTDEFKTEIKELQNENNQENDLSLIEQKLDLKKEIITIGYCPTMKIYVDKIIKKNKFNLKAYSSTSEILYQLKNGNIGVGLIGRIAKSYEIDENITSKKLLDEERYTFISNNKNLLLENELLDKKIYTYLDSEITDKIIPNYTNIVKKTKQEVMDDYQNKLNLISWKDWIDDMELIIPVNQFGNKIEKFRNPYLYYKK